MIPRSTALLPIAQAMRENGGHFARLRNVRLLIYWPHGLGDWTHLGAIAPLFEPSNVYGVLRFGDDYSSIMEGHPCLTQIPSGTAAPGDGSECGAAHLGLQLRRLRGNRTELTLPGALEIRLRAFAPDALLWTDYPETEGRTAYPFHTKARNLARLLVGPERLASFDLSRPLPNAIDFSVPGETQRRVDDCLAGLAPPGTRLCIVSRAGITAMRKNWGDGSEARSFAEMLRGADSKWRFVSMDGDALGDGSAAFRTLFADAGEPFARLYKALAARANLFVGVPAGPLHLTMARGGVPVVGVWLAHHPDWYDEPNSTAVHLVGKGVRDCGFDRRLATTTKPASLRHRLTYLSTPHVPADAVLEAARQVLR